MGHLYAHTVPDVAANSILVRTLNAELSKIVPAPILLTSWDVFGH